MKVLKSYSLGIKQASAQWKMVLVLWAFNLLFAALIYFMGSGYFAGALDRSALAESLRSFNAGLFLEMLVHNQAPLSIIFKVVVGLAFLYFWLSIFLTGGILRILLSANATTGDEPVRRRLAPEFFQGAGRYFGRFFRLEVYSLIFWIVFLLFQLFFNVWAKPLTADGANEKMLYYVFWVRLGLSLLLIFFMRMILDYARIIIARTDTRRVWNSLWEAVAFVLKRLFGTLAVYYILILTGAVIFVVYWTIQSRISTQSLGTIWLAFFIGQLFIVSRSWLRIACQAAQLAFYDLSASSKKPV